MNGEIRMEGLEDILSKLEKIDNPQGITKALGKACAVVERRAKQLAPKDSGDLRRFISSKVDDLQGIVFNPLEYAPYVEYGTGLFAEGGNGRQDVPWAYEDEKTGKLIWTSGQHPHPFMRPALDENREKIKRILLEGITSND